MQKKFPLSVKINFAKLREAHDTAIQAAVGRERLRCLAVVQRCSDDDDIQSCGSATVYIREGIDETPDPECNEYQSPELRVLVQSMRDAAKDSASECVINLNYA